MDAKEMNNLGIRWNPTCSQLENERINEQIHQRAMGASSSGCVPSSQPAQFDDDVGYDDGDA
jgi:hypothetical protein